MFRDSAALLILLLVASAPAAGRFAQSELVIHEQGTNLYHRPGCQVIRDGKNVLALPRAQAEGRGYKPHPDCDPANVKPGPAKGKAAPAASETVYVSGPTYYHRKTCRNLGDEPKALPLETALKTRWPCPVCKAPVLKRTNEPAVPGTDRRRGA